MLRALLPPAARRSTSAASRPEAADTPAWFRPSRSGGRPQRSQAATSHHSSPTRSTSSLTRGPDCAGSRRRAPRSPETFSGLRSCCRDVAGDLMEDAGSLQARDPQPLPTSAVQRQHRKSSQTITSPASDMRICHIAERHSQQHRLARQLKPIGEHLEPPRSVTIVIAPKHRIRGHSRTRHFAVHQHVPTVARRLKPSRQLTAAGHLRLSRASARERSSSAPTRTDSTTPHRHVAQMDYSGSPRSSSTANPRSRAGPSILVVEAGLAASCVPSQGTRYSRVAAMD